MTEPEGSPSSPFSPPFTLPDPHVCKQDSFRKVWNAFKEGGHHAPDEFRHCLMCAADPSHSLAIPFGSEAESMTGDQLCDFLASDEGAPYFQQLATGKQLCQSCHLSGMGPNVFQDDLKSRTVLKIRSDTGFWLCTCGAPTLLCLGMSRRPDQYGILYPSEESGQPQDSEAKASCGLVCVVRGFTKGYVPSVDRWNEWEVNTFDVAQN
ncbi:hypothetical protein TREMEDRAFT_60792 [Tremella mesenterica DSM 1558]|uniref:uncharacterized protein n=1 Tax=Tremella mesenterica (strain ATCC 24925 / CBS 8224 / DSM 1558 / NBRC 9311 / NRRL Y-6157 / RJB 2259-6 / UBC 559-6) TaxID=578456 RepID=UPI0003F4A5AC|nr:uncharacterized protein TREMEDRAFT_60792 [Tremella mesenterica DSM 1558]EIW71869.1 hypothetical protein TREMEDRAFT_60792 [Tremella mesenterica DSM 1558]